MNDDDFAFGLLPDDEPEATATPDPKAARPPAPEDTGPVGEPDATPGLLDLEDAPEAPETPSRTFADFGLLPELEAALGEQGYATPTPIQAQAIPHLVEGRDLLGVAQTGTGKTAAFALPILHRLGQRTKRAKSRKPRALVMTPTRELASQIAERFQAYGQDLAVRGTVVFGGVGQQPQVNALRRGVDVLVATPGRLLDLWGQGHVDFGHVEVFVLDEADRMLDMGFLRDVRKVVDGLPPRRQSLLFSATMPEDIVALTRKLLVDPVRVEVTPPSTTVERIEQSVHFVSKSQKRALLVQLLQDEAIERVLVFTRTKHGADRVVKHLERRGISAAALHGNKSQGARERALEAFRDGKKRVLVATDIAARGLDVPDITHVINFDLPNMPESYVHRIGRTGRAGRDGVAISFCGPDERAYLKAIERETRQTLIVAEPVRIPPLPEGEGRPRSGGGARGRGRHGGARPKASGRRGPGRGRRGRRAR